MFNEEFNNLIELKDTSVLLCKEEVLNKKNEILKKMFCSLNDDNKEKVLKIIKNNTLTNEIKPFLSYEELELFKQTNFSFKNDFIAINILLNAFLNKNIDDFFDEKIK